MEGLTIRPAEARDGPAITSLVLPVFRAGDTYAVDPEISEEDARACWLGPDRRVYLAEDASGGAVGTYYIRPNAGGGGDHVCNCGYVTDPAAQGRGVARAMLRHSLDVARAMGFRAMQFNFVVATNTRAVDTWLKAGFDVVGRLPGAFRHPVQGHVDGLVMWKDLTQAE